MVVMAERVAPMDSPFDAPAPMGEVNGKGRNDGRGLKG